MPSNWQVSIHAPARGATLLPRRLSPRSPVSIHAPARGATTCCATSISLLEFQSTRPHGARPPTCAAFDLFDKVSIHAPARGATLGQAEAQARVVASIHAPARGATGRACTALHPEQVSIHAPARGATKQIAPDGDTVTFQSTLPHGARPPTARTAAAVAGFNPRARTGRDLLHRACSLALMCFNPRARTGRDHVRKRLFGRRVAFQSTRPHGARHSTDRSSP